MNLDHLIDLAARSEHPVVITDDAKDVGFVSKQRLLLGIQGGNND